MSGFGFQPQGSKGFGYARLVALAAGVSMLTAGGAMYVAPGGGVATREVATLQTTDATVTTCLTYTPADNKATTVRVLITSRVSTGLAGASYERTIGVRRTGGTTTALGVTAVHTAETTAAHDATLDVSGTDIRARVTGAAATTMDWACVIDAVVESP